MKLISFVLILFHMIALLCNAGLYGIHGQPTTECFDTYGWCSALQIRLDLCSNPSMKSICRKTCDECNPADCSVCEHECNLKPFECLCREGFRLRDDKKTCEDINECVEFHSPCPGSKTECNNNIGGYSCSEKQESCVTKPGYSSYYKQDKCCRLTNEYSASQKCGATISSTASGRIVGGSDSSTERWPWMVRIIVGEQLCGGSIITDKWIVTAAHCFSIFTGNIDEINIAAGINNITSYKNDKYHQSRKVKKYIIHELFNYPNYDIALIEIDVPFTWTHMVSPLCLPNGESPRTGDTCFATGYGTVQFKGVLAEVLQEVNLPIVYRGFCKKKYERELTKVDPSIMLCAGYEEGRKDACQGDSGGPLMCQRCDSCNFYLAGVTSFGKGCAYPGQYGVYTNVEAMETWISQKTSSVNVTKSICVKTKWGGWSQWSECSVTCSNGTQLRTRDCWNGKEGDRGCQGPVRESKLCVMKLCDSIIGYTNWTDCDKNCGGGMQARAAICQPNDSHLCNESRIEETRICNKFPCPAWSEWKYSECSASCGSGVQVGLRACQNGSPGDIGCEGSLNISKHCLSKRCKIVAEWTEWSECIATCGGGMQQRICLNCNKTLSRSCNTQQCPTWSTWGLWAGCTTTCAGGIQKSLRLCQFANNGRESCTGPVFKTQRCNKHPCPTWSQWSEFSNCDRTCGIGFKSATRTCLNGRTGQVGCSGDIEKMRSCSIGKCAGKFTPWSQWSECSETCNGGVMTRYRQCPNEFCEADGQYYNVTDSKQCNENKCSRKFSVWSLWTECSVPCGGGQQSRHRTCPLETCVGDEHGFLLVQDIACNLHSCPQWSNWRNVGSCSKGCGGGVVKQTRSCLGGIPGSIGCYGGIKRYLGCNTKLCASWDNWGDWSACTSTCGSATRQRTRNCIGASEGEESCIGKAHDIQECFLLECKDECNESCRILVKQNFCFSPTIMNAWFDCDESCCGNCKDSPNIDCSKPKLIGRRCPSYECKATCNLCVNF